MSVIDRVCAEGASGGLICSHVRCFYQDVCDEPPIFYVLNEDELPIGYFIKETLSDTNDGCHREIDDVSNNKLNKSFKLKREPHMFLICDGVTPRKLTLQDMERWKQI
jgi:hypothetical protein